MRMLNVMLEANIMHEPKASALYAQRIIEASSAKPKVLTEWALNYLVPISWHSHGGFSMNIVIMAPSSDQSFYTMSILTK